MQYVVKSGDTLGKIASRHQTTIPAILATNPKIRDASRIDVGDLIEMPQSGNTAAVQGAGPRPTANRATQSPAGLQEAFTVVAEAGKWTLDTLRAIARAFSAEGLVVDAAKFFEGYRKEFGKLGQQQVDGLNALLGFFEADEEMTDLRVAAYMLGTIKHETADTYQPIEEKGVKSYFDRYDPVLADTYVRRETAKKNGNTAEGDGYLYRGRGFVQITWKNNYKALGDALGIDLVGKPERALEPGIAYKIMVYGMRNGTFSDNKTKLSDYIAGDAAPDYFNARHLINKLDKAGDIEGYAKQFETILRAAVQK